MGSDNKYSTLSHGKKLLMDRILNLIILCSAVIIVYVLLYVPYSNNSILNGPYRPHANDYRKIKLKNAFPFTISLFFDNEAEYGKDSVIGDYLDDLATGTTIDILALTGHQIFATEVDGLERVDEKTFIDSKDLYVFGEGKRDEYEVLSDPNPLKSDRRSATMHKLYPTSVQNYLAEKENRKSGNHDRKVVENESHETEERSEEHHIKHIHRESENKQEHNHGHDQGYEQEHEDEKNRKELKAIVKDIKKGGYREADAKGKFAAMQARSQPAKNPSRDDVYNKHFEKHKNAFGQEYSLEVTNLSHKTVVAHQTEEERLKAAEMAQAAWKMLRPKTNTLRQVAPSESKHKINHPTGEKVFKAKHSSEGEYKDTKPDQKFDHIHLEESLHEKIESSEEPGYNTPVRRKGVFAEVNMGIVENIHPKVRYLTEPPTRAVLVKFLSLSPKRIIMWYDDGRNGIFEGKLALGQTTTTNSYEGHVFYFTLEQESSGSFFGGNSGGSINSSKKGREIHRVRIRKEQTLYIIEDKENSPPSSMKNQADKEVQFTSQYFAKTGVQWRHFYGNEGPRPPPSLYMWPADQVGLTHKVDSPEGYWTCKGNAIDCQSNEKVELELECVSTEPRVFVIKNLFSDFEVDWIIDIAKPRLASSQVGGTESGILNSDTRTSTNTWLGRGKNQITETLYMRAADLLQIDEQNLRPSKAAEDIQVVHYSVGQKYDAHHDWGVSGYPESRYVTLLIYLNDMMDDESGGETSFPKAKLANSDNNHQGFKIHPGKGNAVLFYNLLPDGNGDDLALHAALPVKKGEKWLANFWVWDPHKSKNKY